jgi:hypothetical protein
LFKGFILLRGGDFALRRREQGINFLFSEQKVFLVLIHLESSTSPAATRGIHPLQARRGLFNTSRGLGFGLELFPASLFLQFFFELQGLSLLFLGLLFPLPNGLDVLEGPWMP